jgi:hypothetical protein
MQCHLICGFWDLESTWWVRLSGSFFETCGTTNLQYSVTSQKTWSWTSPLCKPQISHKIYFQLHFFIFCTCEWAKKFHPRLLKLFECLILQHISHLYMGFNRIVLDYCKCSEDIYFLSSSPLTIVSAQFNSLAVWLLLLFIVPWRTREFHFVLFLPLNELCPVVKWEMIDICLQSVYFRIQTCVL